MNQCTFIGRITRPITPHQTQNGKTVVTFTLGISNGKDANGNYRDSTFVIVQAWDTYAQTLIEYTDVGSQIGIVCQYKNVKYEKDGETRYQNIFTVKHLELLSTSEKVKIKPQLPEGFEPNSNQPLPEINIDEIETQMPF
jgi:single-stranded DNA-binding protein